MRAELRYIFSEPKVKEALWLIRPSLLGAFIAAWISPVWLIFHQLWTAPVMALTGLACSCVTLWRVWPKYRALKEQQFQPRDADCSSE